MRELNLQKDEMIFECPACGTITVYTDEDTTIEETYGGDKVKCIECPHCGSKNIDYYDRVIGYLTKIKNWSSGRQIEQKTRVYTHYKD